MEHRVSRMEAWIEGHDRLCAERFQALRADIRWALGGLVSLMVVLIGWMAMQLYNDVRPQAPNVSSAVVVQK